MAPASLAVTGAHLWRDLYTGSFPADFPLGAPQRIADNLYVLLSPALPPPLGK